MATRRKSTEPTKIRRPPATTPEGRENQLIALAVDLAERQLSEGTASSQVVTHFLKLGTTRERLEQERISQENELLRAKVEDMATKKHIEELYESALNAMRSYSGQEPNQTYDD